MPEPKICRKCAMPESKPWVWLDGDGGCNICLQYAKDKVPAAQEKALETDFTKILAQHRGKHEYDCLVMCSGGKDSTASLYYMKTRYKTKPLVFTSTTASRPKTRWTTCRGRWKSWECILSSSVPISCTICSRRS